MGDDQAGVAGEGQQDDSEDQRLEASVHGLSPDRAASRAWSWGGYALHLKRDDLELRLFTIITTLGTPVDVSAQELRIESYYPADGATGEWLARQAAGPA